MIAKNMERTAIARRRAGILGGRWIIHPDVFDALRHNVEMDAPRIAETGGEWFFMGMPIEIGIPSDAAEFELVATSRPSPIG